MGIDRQWLALVQKEFGWPEMSSDGSGKITHIVDDLELNVRRVLAGIETWDALANRAVGRVMMFLRAANAEQYCVLFDDGDKVPRNKDIERGMRARRAQHAPFTEQEQASIIVGTTPITVPSTQYFERFMATRPMRAKLRSFIALIMCRAQIPAGKSIVVDAAAPHAIADAFSANPEACGFTWSNARAFDTTNTVAATAAEAAMSAMGINVEVNSGPSLDEPTTIVITARADGSGNDVHISLRPSCVGEGDFKIAHWISQTPAGSHIFVRSSDSDMLPILLMHMRRWCQKRVDPETGASSGSIPYSIYIDTNGPVKNILNERPVLDIVQLFRDVHMYMRKTYPWVRHPIETLCAFMLMSGSDYIKLPKRDADTGEMISVGMGLPQIGPRAIWTAFNHPTCREVMFPRGMQQHPPVRIDAVVDDTTTRIAIAVDERRIYNFVGFMYHRLIFKEYPSADLFFQTPGGRYDFTAARKVASVRFMPPDERDTFVFVRQVAWNLGYLVNGTTESPFDDPFCKNASGVSIYGWRDGAQMDITREIDGTPFAP